MHHRVFLPHRRFALLVVGLISFFCAVAVPASADIISTVAGGGTGNGDGGSATSASLNFGFTGAGNVAVGADGSLYIAETTQHRVRKVSPEGVISTVAGNGTTFVGGDGGPATAAGLAQPRGIAIAADGTLYIGSRNQVRKVSPTGVISTLAVLPLNGQADALALRADGTVYVTDSIRHVVREITPAGVVSVVAGQDGVSGNSGDGGPATAAQLKQPRGVAVDGTAVYVADTGNNRIRKLEAGVITNFAGAGDATAGDTGDGGPAADALLNQPRGLAIANGLLYAAEAAGQVIRTVSLTTGTIDTFAGVADVWGSYCCEGLNGARWLNNTSLASPAGVAVQGTDVYAPLGDGYRVVKITASGDMTTVAGCGTAEITNACLGDGGQALDAGVGNPDQTAIGSDGTLYIAQSATNRVRRVAPDGTISTLAGRHGAYGFSGDGGPAEHAMLRAPRGVLFDPVDDALYIADSSNNRVRKVMLDTGVITTIAGTGTNGFSGDGGPAISAQLYAPTDLELGADGSLYILDTNNRRVRKVDTDGIISTVAGNGSFSYSGDGGPAVNAALRNPSGIAVADDGTLFIADTNNYRVRKVDTDGIISTVVGNGVSAHSGDGGPAADAQVRNPTGVEIAPDGSLIITDTGAHRVRRVGADGIITTIAGTGTSGFSGDGGSAAAAALSGPKQVVYGPTGAMYITDAGNHRVRRVAVAAPANTAVPTIVGEAADGVQLAADAGSWTGSGALSFSFQWLRCDSDGANCEPIPGAASSNYTLTSADVGHTVRVEVTASNEQLGSDGAAVTAQSAPTVSVQPTPPALIAAPVVSGTPTEGEQLTVTDGTWSGTTPLQIRHQWVRCDSDGTNCQPISGATGPSYTLTQQDVGKVILVESAATNAAAPEPVAAPRTELDDSPFAGGVTVADDPSTVPPQNTAAPGVTGPAAVGATVSASRGTWLGTGPLQFSYRWQRETGGAFTDIAGAEQASYLVSAQDVGHRIRVMVTAVNSYGEQDAPSEPTAAVITNGGDNGGGGNGGGGDNGGDGGDDGDEQLPRPVLTQVRFPKRALSYGARAVRYRRDAAKCAKAKPSSKKRKCRQRAVARRQLPLRFRLNTAASVKLELVADRAGVKRGGRCTLKRRGRHGKRCVIRKVLAQRKFAAAAGVTRRMLPAVFDRKLRKGSYRLRLVASNDTGSSRLVTAKFKIR